MQWSIRMLDVFESAFPHTPWVERAGVVGVPVPTLSLRPVSQHSLRGVRRTRLLGFVSPVADKETET